jgi:hypothetical protein
LYRGDYAELEKCPNCDTSCYKSNTDFAVKRVIASKGTKRKVGGKKCAFSQVEEEYSIGTDTSSRHKVPALLMWYLPVEDCLKRLFSNPKTAELMTWHADCPEKSDGKLQHPSHARQWRTFDSKNKKFRDEKRNILFTLSTDGMNPFGERSSTHSTWPVSMTIYNLAMSQEKFPFAYHSNPRTEATGIDIDVFLKPLMEEMEKFWKHGVEMWDEYSRRHSHLRQLSLLPLMITLSYFLCLVR